ncbi:uncharacterized protein HMPREF1541_09343 [Cyphellophora europaea CBS 101466]|uniref:Uncharacterized protein n=1 Tax=Cyphellophora europaea (strain CBS 101466) TaxID=1220924 RepID=W2S9W0_CYPE1|nr:uncharacterized protein HMPREF1541_09343 [Cyphellophora europaea CBS 101466]ETN45511.1 hypothetical protein HMPREF1541_09343 [Cyphellophora europaea CBS 101466]
MHNEYGVTATSIEPKADDSLQNSSSEDNLHAISSAKSGDESAAGETEGATTESTSDLYLHIAKDAAINRHAASAQEKPTSGSRRSRISLPFLSSSRPTTSLKPSPMSTHFEPETQSLPQRLGKRASLGPHVPGALTSSTYYSETPSRAGVPVDQSSNADTSDIRSQARSRRHSNANPETLRPPTRSYQARLRLASENVYADRMRMQEPTKTESTISTTAPSTVWDELDDLKSRIKKLELTGKIPSSSAAAMTTSNERPRTGSTQATALSSSPKNKPSGPNNETPSAVPGVPSTVHPTLHEALTNARSSVRTEIYQKLQATAQDALQLSTMVNHDYTGTSNMTPQSERMIRRRTESLCRSLTELAIAMLDDSRANNSPTSRPGSRDPFTGGQLRSRRRSDSTEHPPVVSSRIVSRRTSLANSAEPSPRPVSRAMTEAPSSYRQATASRTNFSREYTRQHPLPVTDGIKAATPQASLVSRRTGAVNTTPTAASPAVQSSPVPFTISIERNPPTALPRPTTFPDSPASVVSEASPRAPGRRTGFAARVSSVSSRLKAAREQRLASLAAAGGSGANPV